MALNNPTISRIDITYDHGAPATANVYLGSAQIPSEVEFTDGVTQIFDPATSDLLATLTISPPA